MLLGLFLLGFLVLVWLLSLVVVVVAECTLPEHVLDQAVQAVNLDMLMT